MKRKVFFRHVELQHSTSWVRAERNRRRRGLKGLPLLPSPDLNFFWWLVLSLKLSPPLLIRASSAWLCKSGSLLKLLLIMELMIQQKLSKFFITKVYLEFGKRLDYVCHYSNYFLYCAFALSSLSYLLSIRSIVGGYVFS